MSFFARSLRTSALALFCSLAFLCTGLTSAQTTSTKPRFTSAQVQATATEVTGFAFADTQATGHQDILYLGKPTADSSVTVGLLLNNGTGTFSDVAQNRHVFQNVSGVAAAIADMDGDGNPDFVFATSPRTSGGAQLCILSGTASAATSGAYALAKSGCTSFTLPADQVPVFSSITASPAAPGVAPRLYLADSANGLLYVVAGDGRSGDGTNLPGYALIASYPLSAAASSQTAASQFALAAFKSAKTQQDLVVQQGALLVPYANTGDGEHFTALAPLPATPSSSALVPAALRLADLDGDGNTDVVALYNNPAAGSDPNASPNQLYIWFGNGNGTFAQPQIVSLSRPFTMAAVADMDNDGRPDIILSDNAVVSVLYNQGSHTFLSDFGSGCTTTCAEQQFPATQGINALAVLDVTGDGKPEIVVANGSQSPAAARTASQFGSPAAPRAGTSTTSSGVTVISNVSGTTAISGSVNAQPEPSSVNQDIGVTIIITPTSGTIPPSGNVELSIGGAPVGTFPISPIAGSVTNSSGVTVSVHTTGAPAGTYPLSVVYDGDSIYASNAGNPITGSHTIAANGTTTTLLMCVGPATGCPSSGPFTLPAYTPNISMTYGQYINVAAPVTKNDPSNQTGLTGTITFTLDGSVICTYTVFTGQCPATAIQTLESRLTTGQHTLVATYSNDPNYGGSSSQVVINIAPDTTTTTISPSSTTALQGAPVTFTITVTGQFAPPTGTFTLSGGGTSLGTATLSPSGATTSTATFTTSTLPVGTNQVSANYGGNQNFAPSGSGTITVTITTPANPSFSLTVGPQSVSVGPGNTTALAVTVTSVNGFAGTVNLTCGGLPSESTCTFANPAINGAGVTTLFLATTAPHSCNSAQPYFIGSNGNSGFGLPLALPALAGVFALFIPGRRRWLRGLLMLALATGVMQLTGCGNCTDLATRPGTYHITVTATSGSTTVTQPVTLNVVI